MKRSRQIYMEDELWCNVDSVVAKRQEAGEDVSRSRWVEAAIRLALADGENLEVKPAPITPWSRQKIKATAPAVREPDNPEPPVEIPIAISPPPEDVLTEAVRRFEDQVREAHHQPAEGVAGPPSQAPATPPGPDRPQRARVPSMAEHLSLNPQLVAGDLDSHMALNPDLAGTPVVPSAPQVPGPYGTPVDEVADFSAEPTLPPAAIERLKDETGPNPVVVHAVAILYEKVDGKWCWTCPDAGITGVSSYVNDIRADAWDLLTAHYGHDNLTLEVRRKP